MRRLTPITGFFIVLTIIAGVLIADYAFRGGFRHAGYERIAPDAQGVVKIDLAELATDEVRFYRFLNPSNQEVKFFVGRDRNDTIQVAFDAAESDFKMGRGFRAHEGWMVNNKCDTAVRLTEVNEGRGGCRPIPLEHRIAGTTLIVREDQVLKGWRYFR